jgi:hypothetical protein
MCQGVHNKFSRNSVKFVSFEKYNFYEVQVVKEVQSNNSNLRNELAEWRALPTTPVVFAEQAKNFFIFPFVLSLKYCQLNN